MADLASVLGQGEGEDKGKAVPQEHELEKQLVPEHERYDNMDTPPEEQTVTPQQLEIVEYQV